MSSRCRLSSKAGLWSDVPNLLASENEATFELGPSIGAGDALRTDPYGEGAERRIGRKCAVGEITQHGQAFDARHKPQPLVLGGGRIEAPDLRAQILRPVIASPRSGLSWRAVAGALDLSRKRVEIPLSYRDCEFDAPLVAAGALAPRRELSVPDRICESPKSAGEAL